jgi:hypothetical protein
MRLKAYSTTDRVNDPVSALRAAGRVARRRVQPATQRIAAKTPQINHLIAKKILGAHSLTEKAAGISGLSSSSPGLSRPSTSFLLPGPKDADARGQARA